MIEEKNNELFLRPRFQIELKKNQKEILKSFEFSKKNSEGLLLKIRDEHIVLDVAKTESTFWSPQLQLEIIYIKENESLVKGLFGPKPQIWTFFMFLHFGLATLFIGFLMLTYVQWTLKNNYTLPLIITLVLPIGAVILYFLGSYGKTKGQDQMLQLHNFMEKMLVETI